MPVKTVLLLKRKRGMTSEAFRTAYETRHSRLALRLFGHLWVEYRRNYLGAAASLADESGTPSDLQLDATACPYDVVTEIVYRDMQALEESNRIAALAENRRLLAEDEASMFDREASFATVVETVEDRLQSE